MDQEEQRHKASEDSHNVLQLQYENLVSDMNRSKAELAEVSRLHSEFKEKHEQTLKDSEKKNSEHAQALERIIAERDRLQQKYDSFSDVRENDQRKINEL